MRITRAWDELEKSIEPDKNWEEQLEFICIWRRSNNFGDIKEVIKKMKKENLVAAMEEITYLPTAEFGTEFDHMDDHHECYGASIFERYFLSVIPDAVEDACKRTVKFKGKKFL